MVEEFPIGLEATLGALMSFVGVKKTYMTFFDPK
jgi:hypothetical protein